MKSELRLQRQIMIDCGVKGWLCYHFNPGGALRPDGFYFNSGVPEGWPDLIVITKTNTYYIELKTLKGKASKKQLWFQNRLPNSYIIRSLKQWQNASKSFV